MRTEKEEEDIVDGNVTREIVSPLPEVALQARRRRERLGFAGR